MDDIVTDMQDAARALAYISATLRQGGDVGAVLSEVGYSLDDLECIAEHVARTAAELAAVRRGPRVRVAILPGDATPPATPVL